MFKNIGEWFNRIKKNWKTSSAALLGAFYLLYGQIYLGFDNNPQTMIDWNIVLGQGSLIVGLLFSRDADVSSEQSDAK